ncbi:MAG: hypothetical protein AABZ44_01695 [Elusimicrobiota bacterium]
MNTMIKLAKSLTVVTGQATIEYVLATTLFMGLFVALHQIVSDSLKKLFANAAFYILTSYK